MPIVSTDIKIFYSGGSGNTDPNASLGGVKSSTEPTDNTLNNLFDDVSGTESNAGDTEYRGIYVYNNHGTLTMQNTKVYIGSDSSSADDAWAIALAGEGVNATMETISDESTAPVGETFSSPTTYAGGLSMGSIAPGQRYGLWIRRTVNAGAAADNNDAATLKVDCDTAA
jgi:hypothetical protein